MRASYYLPGRKVNYNDDPLSCGVTFDGLAKPKNKPPQSVAEYFRRLREGYDGGGKVESIARDLGVGAVQWWRIENGKRKPGPDFLRAIYKEIRKPQNEGVSKEPLDLLVLWLDEIGLGDYATEIRAKLEKK